MSKVAYETIRFMAKDLAWGQPIGGINDWQKIWSRDLINTTWHFTKSIVWC